MVYLRKIIEALQNYGASLNIKSKAKELRKNMTEPEKMLWNYLRKKQQCGMRFRRQHPYGIYILDFYCFEAKLVIEIDGQVHLNQKDYYLERTKGGNRKGGNPKYTTNRKGDNPIQEE